MYCTVLGKIPAFKNKFELRFLRKVHVGRGKSERERDGERERDREREFVGWLCKCVGAWWQKPSPKGTISDEFSPPEITNSRLGANVLSVKPGV